MGLPSTPYFLCFHYFGSAVAHSHISTSYTAHNLLISLFPNSFKPIYPLKAHLFISWACDPLFLPLGLNGFSIHLPILFCPRYWASPFHLDFQNGHQHFLHKSIVDLHEPSHGRTSGEAFHSDAIQIGRALRAMADID